MRVLYGIRTYLNIRRTTFRKGVLKQYFQVIRTYENILSTVNLPTLHHRRDELCRAYFAKMKSNDHKLNAILPNGRSVPFISRSCNDLPIPRANTNRYKHSLIPWCVGKRLIMDQYFNRQFNLLSF